MSIRGVFFLMITICMVRVYAMEIQEYKELHAVLNASDEETVNKENVPADVVIDINELDKEGLQAALLDAVTFKDKNRALVETVLGKMPVEHIKKIAAPLLTRSRQKLKESVQLVELLTQLLDWQNNQDEESREALLIKQRVVYFWATAALVNFLTVIITNVG